MMDMDGSGQGVTFMKKVQKKSGKAEDQSSSPSQSQPRQDGKAKPGEKDWERIYHELSAKIEHNDTEMRGHTHTFKDRAKRLLQLRDTRSREAELLRLERGFTGPNSRDGNLRDSDADTGISGSQPRHWTGSQREQMTEEPSPTCIRNQCSAQGV
jgi:hypothetical protein